MSQTICAARSRVGMKEGRGHCSISARRDSWASDLIRSYLDGGGGDDHNDDDDADDGAPQAGDDGAPQAGDDGAPQAGDDGAPQAASDVDQDEELATVGPLSVTHFAPTPP